MAETQNTDPPSGPLTPDQAAELERDQKIYNDLSSEQRADLDRIARGESAGSVLIDLDEIDDASMHEEPASASSE